jgi:hypothetical protein
MSTQPQRYYTLEAYFTFSSPVSAKACSSLSLVRMWDNTSSKALRYGVAEQAMKSRPRCTCLLGHVRFCSRNYIKVCLASLRLTRVY